MSVRVRNRILKQVTAHEKAGCRVLNANQLAEEYAQHLNKDETETARLRETVLEQCAALEAEGVLRAHQSIQTYMNSRTPHVWAGYYRIVSLGV